MYLVKKLLLIPLTFGFGSLLFSTGCGTDNTAEVPSAYKETQRSADNPKKLQGAGGPGSEMDEGNTNVAPPPPDLPEP